MKITGLTTITLLAAGIGTCRTVSASSVAVDAELNSEQQSDLQGHVKVGSGASSTNISHFLRQLLGIDSGSNEPENVDEVALSNENFVQLAGEKEACFGSLIHVDMVLTAAQCVRHLRVNDTVFIGLSPFYESKEIVSLIPHPSFDFPYYDYMLVKLDSPVKDVRPRAIRQDHSKTSVGDEMEIVCPRATNASATRCTASSSTLLKILSRDDCQQMFQQPIIDPLMICATSRNVNTEVTGRCSSSAGSPLIDKLGYQIGVLSAGQGAFDSDSSAVGIFSRVSWVSPWIREIICATSTYPSIYCTTE